MMQSQSLWDFVEEEQARTDEENLATPAQPVTELPEYFVHGPYRWADGDTSPAQLERLSHVILGDNALVQWRGWWYKYTIVTTAVIGDKVWAACKFWEKLYPVGGQQQGDEDE